MSVTVVNKDIHAAIVARIREEVKGDSLKLRALETFQKLGLPANKSEEYKHTPITRELEKNFSFTKSNPAEDKISIEPFIIPGLSANVLVFINGQFSKSRSKIVSPSTELTILPLEEALAQNHPIVQQNFGKYADHNNDAFAAWNTAEWRSGVFIHVQKNVNAETPVIIYHVSDTSNDEVTVSQRNLVVVEKSAELTVIEKFDSRGTTGNFLNLVTEVSVDENAGFNLYSIQNDEGPRFQHTLTEIHQKKSSRVNTYTFTLNGKLVRNNLHLVLDGEGIESHMYGLYLLGGETLGDNHTVVDHRQANSFSNELYKGIMDGNSRGVFNGKIYVRPNAQKTNAFQANRNILLGSKSTVNTKPQLEIWADDVKCSHGCTSGQLDEEAMFYIQTRGIAKETAQAMMLYAFAGEVLDSVKHPVLKEYLDKIVSERLHKNF